MSAWRSAFVDRANAARFRRSGATSPVSRDYDHQENFSFDPSKIPLSSDTGIAVVPYGDQIIARCNQHLQPDGPTKSHSFTHSFHASFSALTDTALDMDNAVSEAQGGSWPHPLYDSHYAEHGSFDVQIVCDPVIKPPVQDVANDFGEFDVDNVKLFLTTYQSNQTGSTPGTVCPSLKVTSRAQANQAGPVSMRIWRQKNDGPITSEVQQAWASYDATKNGYFATYEKWEDVGATAYFQYKTEIIGNGPFEPFDGWKDITVHCTGAGGGGFTDAPQDNPDNPPAHSDWQGEVTVSDSAGFKKLCPRKGQVAFEVEREAPGAFHYRISCSNGAFFTGTTAAFNDGGVFKASAAHELSIVRTRSIQCTLQEIKQNGSIATVDNSSEDFTCIKRNFDPNADGLAVDTPPRPRQTATSAGRHRCRPHMPAEPEADPWQMRRQAARGCLPQHRKACQRQVHRGQHPLPARLPSGRPEMRAQCGDRRQVQAQRTAHRREMRAQALHHYRLQARLSSGRQGMR